MNDVDKNNIDIEINSRSLNPESCLPALHSNVKWKKVLPYFGQFMYRKVKDTNVLTSKYSTILYKSSLKTFNSNEKKVKFSFIFVFFVDQIEKIKTYCVKKCYILLFPTKHNEK